MADATFTVNGSAVTDAVAVSASSTVTLALADTTGVRANIDWSIVGNHSSSATNPTITKSGTPHGSTATFTMPAGSNQSYIIECVIDGGVDVNGRADSAMRRRAIVGVYNDNTIVPFCVGEENERNLTHGTTEILNYLLNLPGSSGGGPDAESAQLDVTANATKTVGAYYDYDPGLSVGEQVVVGAYVHIAQDDTRTNTGVVRGTVAVTRTAGGLAFCGTANVSWDKSGVYSAVGATQHDADFAISGTNLRVNVYAIGTDDAVARIRMYRESDPLAWTA